MTDWRTSSVPKEGPARACIRLRAQDHGGFAQTGISATSNTLAAFRPDQSLRPRLLLALSAGLLAVSLMGCQDSADPDAVDCSRQPPLSYDNFGKGFLERNCTGCHSIYLTDPETRNYAPVGVDFNTYSDVLHWGERIQVRTYVDMDMPPAGGLLQTDLDMLNEWVQCSVLTDKAAQEGSP